MEEAVLKPLGMAPGGYEWTPAFEDAAVPYSGAHEPRRYQPVVRAAGGLYTAERRLRT